MKYQSLEPSEIPGRKVSGRFFQRAAKDMIGLIGQHLPAQYPVLPDCLQTLINQPAWHFQGPEKYFSKLTCQGYPLEVAYVWPANSFRFTIDLIPGATPVDRFQQSLEFVGSLLNPDQQNLCDRLKTWLFAKGGKYGAWIGGRCKEGRMQYKLYLEVPENAPWQQWEENFVGANCEMVNNLRLVMIGIDPLSGESEFYYRMEGLNLPAMRPLQLRYHLADRSPEIVQMLGSLYQRNIRFEIPSANLGYSINFSSKQKAQAFTLYSIANSMLGDDRRARESILRLGQQMGWPMDFYKKATQRLTVMDIHPRDTWHGMLGIVAAPKSPLQFTIGWTPLTISHE